MTPINKLTKIKRCSKNMSVGFHQCYILYKKRDENNGFPYLHINVNIYVSFNLMTCVGHRRNFVTILHK